MLGSEKNLSGEQAVRRTVCSQDTNRSVYSPVSQCRDTWTGSMELQFNSAGNIPWMNVDGGYIRKVIYGLTLTNNPSPLINYPKILLLNIIKC